MTPNAVTPARSSTAAPTSRRLDAPVRRRLSGRPAAARAATGRSSADRGQGSRRAARAARRRARRRSPPRGGSARRGRPRAPPTAGRSGRARASAGRAGARAAAARRRAPSSSPITSACRPASRSASIALSEARRRSSSRRRISGAANGSSARSASASPCQSASASRGRRFVEQALEAHGVDIAVGQLQLVAAAVGHDPDAVPVERAPQVRDVELHHLRGARRRRLAPQPLGEPIRRHRPALLEREHREYRPLLAGAQLDGPVLEANLERPQEPHVHRGPSLLRPT